MEEREVELTDYLNVLWKWRWLIVVGTLACVLVGGLITMLLPKTYQITATIDAGDVSGERMKDVERLVVRLNVDNLFAGAMRASPMGQAALTAQFKKPPLIELAVETESPGEAVKGLDQTARSLLDELQRILRAQEEGDVERLNALRDQINRLHAEEEMLGRRIKELRQSLGNLQKSRSEILSRAGDPAWSLVFTRLSDEIASKESALAQVEEQLSSSLPMRVRDLQAQVDGVSHKLSAIRSPRLVGGPVIPRAPIKPRLKLNLAASFVAGFVGFVWLAFVLEHLEKARRRGLQSAQ